jgi:hypothetical protein
MFLSIELVCVRNLLANFSPSGLNPAWTKPIYSIWLSKQATIFAVLSIPVFVEEIVRGTNDSFVIIE